MLQHITSGLRPALVLLFALAGITGIAYPLAITGVAQIALPYQANGSLVRDEERIVGSALIGQAFADPRYFQGRASAAGDGYDASASSGSNLGPTSADLRTSIEERVAAARASGMTGSVPADMATASGSGLDPHVSPDHAMMQAARVASARGLDPATVRDLVLGAVERPLIGEPVVNVLLLNRQLDRASAQIGR